MKAVMFHEFGGLDVLELEEVPDLEPGPGEVALDVLAFALNHLDVDIREGTSRFSVDFRSSQGSRSWPASPRSAKASPAGKWASGSCRT